eukprot:12156367-Prorocentrum_lima.AAC.1
MLRGFVCGCPSFILAWPWCKRAAQSKTLSLPTMAIGSSPQALFTVNWAHSFGSTLTLLPTS